LTKEQVEKLPASEKNFVSVFGNRFLLQPPPTRFVNHSCEPNTFVKGFCDVALRDIAKGEEITANYLGEGTLNQNFVCKCGSKKCARRISS